MRETERVRGRCGSKKEDADEKNERGEELRVELRSLRRMRRTQVAANALGTQLSAAHFIEKGHRMGKQP